MKMKMKMKMMMKRMMKMMMMKDDDEGSIPIDPTLIQSRSHNDPAMIPI